MRSGIGLPITLPAGEATDDGGTLGVARREVPGLLHPLRLQARSSMSGTCSRASLASTFTSRGPEGARALAGGHPRCGPSRADAGGGARGSGAVPPPRHRRPRRPARCSTPATFAPTATTASRSRAFSGIRHVAFTRSSWRGRRSATAGRATGLVKPSCETLARVAARAGIPVPGDEGLEVYCRKRERLQVKDTMEFHRTRSVHGGCSRRNSPREHASLW